MYEWCSKLFLWTSSKCRIDYLLGLCDVLLYLGAWGVVYTYTPELYPTAIRAMGSGWAAGVGRIGGMAAPLVVGMMIEAGSDMHTVFYMFASVFIIIAVAVFALGVETKQKNLENI